MFCGDHNFIDVVFMLQIWIRENVYPIQIENSLYVVLFGVSVLFIAIPITASIVQLQKEIKEWLHDVDTKDIIPAWIQENLRLLYMLTIVSGNAFTAVGICNTNLFGLSVFDMVV